MIARHLAFFAPAAVLSAWATVMLHTIAAGHLNRLLSPFFRNYVLAAAILLLLLSALYLFLYEAPPEPAASPLAPTGRWRQTCRWLVMLLPLLGAAVLSPDALSNTTLNNRAGVSSTTGVMPMPTMSAASAENVRQALEADPNQPVPVEITDLIALSRKPQQLAAFEGRKIRTVGFISGQGGNAKLVRGMMWCCAADVQPVSVEIGGNLAGNWKENQWLETIGTARFPSTLGHVIPRIEVDTVQAVPEPDEPYLSP